MCDVSENDLIKARPFLTCPLNQRTRFLSKISLFKRWRRVAVCHDRRNVEELQRKEAL